MLDNQSNNLRIPPRAQPLGWQNISKGPLMGPDFARYAWVSEPAKLFWEPRVSAIIHAWSKLERLSVVHNLRSCALQSIEAEELLGLSEWCAEHEMSFLMLTKQARPTSLYSSTGRAAVEGEPFSYRYALGTQDNVIEFYQAFKAQDDEKIGRLLGFPSCCREFFSEAWNILRWIDTSWPMACSTDNVEIGNDNLLYVSGPLESNILLRWLGIRAVPHLPCSFDCSETAELGKSFFALGRGSGFEREMDWLEEMLEWPISWSARVGIAEIKTPVLKISTRTDSIFKTLTVHRNGKSYPEHGAKSPNFPFRLGAEAPTTNDRYDGCNLAEDLHSDNGFSSAEAMAFAHAPIIQCASKALSGSDRRILDLGCGNGMLLHSIYQEIATCIPYGVDLDPEKIQKSVQLCEGFAQNFMVGNLTDPNSWLRLNEVFDLVILMPGRLLECSNSEAKNVRDKLRHHAKKILLYAYADTTEKHAGLEKLASLAGFKLLGFEPGSCVNLAVVSD